MMKYNTKLKRLPLPEYGRAVQMMVDHAVAIEDREERQRCANAIIGIMGNMFPQLRDVPEFTHKLWDHLAIMADFKLDIDYPYEIVKPEAYNKKPDKLNYSHGAIRYRHYGRSVQKLIEAAVNMEEGEAKEQLIRLIAIQMKKDYLAWNKDGVEDRKIFDDIREYSDGRINIDESRMRLDLAPVAPPRPASNNHQQHRKMQPGGKRKY